MPNPKVFISYRREDTGGYAGRLFDHLEKRFPKRVFMDVDTIAAGADFVYELRRSIQSSDAVVALIGRHWLTAANSIGRRLDDPSDFVRLELEVAMEAGIRIIPALVSGATMPTPADLPESVRGLTRRQAIELRDTTFLRDVERLAGQLREIAALVDFERRENAAAEERRRKEAAQCEREAEQARAAAARAQEHIAPSPHADSRRWMFRSGWNSATAFGIGALVPFFAEQIRAAIPGLQFPNIFWWHWAILASYFVGACICSVGLRVPREAVKTTVSKALVTGTAAILFGYFYTVGGNIPEGSDPWFPTRVLYALMALQAVTYTSRSRGVVWWHAALLAGLCGVAAFHPMETKSVIFDGGVNSVGVRVFGIDVSGSDDCCGDSLRQLFITRWSWPLFHALCNSDFPMPKTVVPRGTYVAYMWLLGGSLGALRSRYVPRKS